MGEMVKNSNQNNSDKIGRHNNTISNFDAESNGYTHLEKCIDKECNEALISSNKIKDIELSRIKHIKAKEFIEALFQIIIENNI